MNKQYIITYKFVPTQGAHRDGILASYGKEKTVWAKDPDSAKELFREKYGEFAIAGNLYGTREIIKAIEL